MNKIIDWIDVSNQTKEVPEMFRQIVTKTLLLCAIMTEGIVQYASAQEGFVFELHPHDPQAMAVYTFQNKGQESVSLDIEVESADSTYILYVDEPDISTFNGNIWRMRPNGSEKMQLTFDMLDREAVWSPEASRIAFYSYQSGNSDVWVMNADGTNLTNLTNHEAEDVNPQWSPDGHHIVFSSDRDDANGEIYRMTATGEDVQRLTSNDVQDSRPRYSPDGQHFVTQSRIPGGERDIYVYTSDGQSYVNIGVQNIDHDFQPSWTPDGKRVVWASGDHNMGELDIVSANKDGSDLRLEFATPENDYIPRFSPDGQFLAFSKSTFYPTGGDEVFIWHKALDRLTQITDRTPVTREWGPEWSPFFSPPTWVTMSPNAVQIEPGESANITITVDASNLPLGDHTASLLIHDFAGGSLLAAVPVNVLYSEIMSVTVLEPNGGEQWNEDAPHPVRWTTTDSINVTNVKIEHSTDNGSSYTTITDSTENNGQFEWLVFRDPSNNHKVRITVSDESGNTASDESDAVFTVHDVDTYVAEAGELRMTIRNDGWTGWRTNIAAGEPHMEYPAGSEHYHLYNSKLVIAYTRSDVDTVGTFVYDDDYAPVSSMIIEDWADHLLLNSTYTYKWNNDLLVHQRVLVPKTSGDFIIYIYTLENTTTKVIDDLYVGNFNDFDINDWTKNMTGFDSLNRLAYMYDDSSDGYTSYVGAAMLTRTPVFHRWMSGTDPLKGGPMYLRMADRTNDVTSDDQAGDYRVMLHTDKVFLAPGAKYAIVMTLLAGEGLAGIQSAAESALVFWNALNLDLTDEVTTPQKFTLHANYPNPFNPSTTISYDLPEQAQVTLGIYDLLGKQIKTLVNQSQDAGSKTAVWDGTDELGRSVSAGVYLYRIQAGEFSQTRKMLLLK